MPALASSMREGAVATRYLLGHNSIRRDKSLRFTLRKAPSLSSSSFNKLKLCSWLRVPHELRVVRGGHHLRLVRVLTHPLAHPDVTNARSRCATGSDVTPSHFSQRKLKIVLDFLLPPTGCAIFCPKVPHSPTLSAQTRRRRRTLFMRVHTHTHTHRNHHLTS
jgi:hypothetical protein